MNDRLADIESNRAYQRRVSGSPDWFNPEVSLHYLDMQWLISEVKRLRIEQHHHTVRRPRTGDYWCVECHEWFEFPVGGDGHD